VALRCTGCNNVDIRARARDLAMAVTRVAHLLTQLPWPSMPWRCLLTPESHCTARSTGCGKLNFSLQAWWL